MTDRAERIQKSLTPATRMSESASDVNARIQDALVDLDELDEKEQARLLAALVAQLGAKLGRLYD